MSELVRRGESGTGDAAAKLFVDVLPKSIEGTACQVQASSSGISPLAQTRSWHSTDDVAPLRNLVRNLT